MAGIGRKRKKCKSPVSNRGHLHAACLGVESEEDSNNENVSSNEHNGSLITPPPQKRVMRDNTNITNNSSPISSILKDMDSEVTANVGPQALAEKIVELLEFLLSKDEDIQQTLKLIADQIGETTEYVPPDLPLPKLKAKPTVAPVTYKADIFQFNTYNPTIEVTNEATWKSTRYRCQKQLIEALDNCGSLQHQMYLIHRVLTRGNRAAIGAGLGLMESRLIEDEATVKKTVLQIDDFLHSGHILGRNTNDALTFQNMAYVLM
ncbi:MAG: hypothetical protein ACRCZI_02750, partial [Cetobacterium sp.]